MSEHTAIRHIDITLNAEPRRVPAGCTLERLVLEQGVEPHEVATALNGDFVPRALRASRVLVAGDAVTCFRPIVGG